MLKQLKTKTPLLIGSGCAILVLIGTVWLTPKAVDWIEQSHQSQLEKTLTEDSQNPSAVLKLVSLPTEQREAKLKEIASQENVSLDRSRARYLLAVDYIKKYEGGLALKQLDGLEKEYPVLAPYILLKRGRAYELTNEKTQAQETWKKLLEDYPKSPVVVDALYYLGRSNPQYWHQAIAKFPSHPRTWEIARQSLQDNPKQPNLLLLLAKYAPITETNSIRDRLVKDYDKQLTPQDWAIIGNGYWQMREYKKAVQAYQQAPHTPESLYRSARGLQLGKEKANIETVKKRYQQLVKAFPNAPETALGLKRLARISQPSEAITYLNLIIKKFPEDAPEALFKKAEILEKTNPTAAAKTREALLKKYANSDAAADYRWQVAQKAAEAGNSFKAWQWAQPITQYNPESPLAPKAAFWVGKWAQQLGRQEDAKTAFEHILARYPQSYYAWRSAVLLGWNVGDFNDVRYHSPNLIKPSLRPLPPAGSDLFKELYRLGQDQEAIALFQAETGNQKQLDVTQQFTEALLKLLQGKNLQGINQVLDLRNQDNPEDKKQWQELRETSEYWQVLFPFPFYENIVDWSKQRQLNPLLVTSLIRQESRFEPEIKSPVGATGLMQVMPATGKWVADKIDLNKYSLINPNDNINLGTWYLDHTHQEYNNNSLLAVASYNAGPGNVAKWLKKFQTKDPDVFVEKIPFDETKGYVESVFGNYWNYLRIYNPEIANSLSQYTGKNLVQ